MPAVRSRAERVAASMLTRQLIAGPPRTGRVLGVFASAVYLAVPVEFGAGAPSDVLAVEAADGLRLPRAAILAAPSSTRPFRAVRVGEVAQVGEGRVDVGPLAFDVVRWWSPRRPRAVTTSGYDDARLTAISRLLPALPHELDDRLTSLTTALGAARLEDLADAATALLGLGAGLTPQGDDVLAGVLVTLVAVPELRLSARRLADAVAASAPHRTTMLSGTLLRDAADGFAVPALVDLVDALRELDEGAARTTTHRALADVVVRLLAVGQTSGAALAHGAVAAARLHAAMPARGEGGLT